MSNHTNADVVFPRHRINVLHEQPNCSWSSAVPDLKLPEPRDVVWCGGG